MQPRQSASTAHNISVAATQTTLDKSVSTRLDLLRFPAILGVLFIHSATTSMHTVDGTLGASHSSPSVEVIKYCIAKGIAAPAVPLLFMMSGFLFFEGFAFSWNAYGEKLRRRTKTLLIPFVLWNCLTLLAYAVGENLRVTRPYFLGNPQWPLISAFGWIDCFKAFGIGSVYPIAYHFWYVRDLMAMILLVPLLCIMLTNRIALWVLASLVFLWITGSWPLVWPGAGVLLFFCCGAYLSVKKLDISRLNGRWGWFVLALFISLLVVDVASRQNAFHEAIHKVLILVAIVNAWWITSILARSHTVSASLIWLSSTSFFVYVAHEPLLMITRRLSLRILEQHSDIAVLLYFISVPICLSVALVLVYVALHSYAPSFLRIIAGGSRQHHRVLVDRLGSH